MKVIILTSPNQWFTSYADELSSKIEDSIVIYDHKLIEKGYDILFALSYHKIIEKEYLIAKHNIVIHASKLPKGKGWAPMFWQILENKNIIPFSMFEISETIDGGDIYLQRELVLSGFELNSELRYKQAVFISNMCLDFIKNYENYKYPKKQVGKDSFYRKRTLEDSQLDINKTILSQFNLLRIVDNENYPAFFYFNNKKYILKIEEVKDENR